MANIIELRDKTNDELVQLIENLQEEMFNLRFQHAGARLQNPTRIRTVRREMAQIKNVLGNRQLAVDSAMSRAEIAQTLNGKEWASAAKYSYEDGAYNVDFTVDGTSIASAVVDLNKKQLTGRSARGTFVQRVTSFEVK